MVRLWLRTIQIQANRHFGQLKWWEHKSSSDVVQRSHFYTHEALRIASILLQPFMPTKANEVLSALGVEDRRWESTVLGASGVPVDSRYKPSYKSLFPPLGTGSA